MTAPVPPFMPAPRPRPSSRAVALLGARCPNATDLGSTIRGLAYALLGAYSGVCMCQTVPSSRTHLETHHEYMGVHCGRILA